MFRPWKYMSFFILHINSQYLPLFTSLSLSPSFLVFSLFLLPLYFSFTQTHFLLFFFGLSLSLFRSLSLFIYHPLSLSLSFALSLSLSPSLSLSNLWFWFLMVIGFCGNSENANGDFHLMGSKFIDSCKIVCLMVFIVKPH